MVDTATPATGAESLSEAGAEGALESIFGQPDKPAARAPAVKEEVEASDAATPDDELDVTDLPEDGDEEGVEKEANADEAFDIVHNGQTVKLSRAEMVANAQKGFDYERKTAAVAETQRQFGEGLRRLAEVEQVQPMLMNELAGVVAMQQQLQQYQQVDWERLATDDPLGFPAHQARFMKLSGQAQQAAQLLQQKFAVVQQHREQLSSTLLQQEHARLAEVVPAWKDHAKLETDKVAMGKYLEANGVPLAVAGRYLDSAVAMKVLRQSMLYEGLQKAKADKSKQLRGAPPVIRPGANVPSDKGRTQFVKARQAIRTAGTQGRHGDQERAMVSLLERTYGK